MLIVQYSMAHKFKDVYLCPICSTLAAIPRVVGVLQEENCRVWQWVWWNGSETGLLQTYIWRTGRCVWISPTKPWQKRGCHYILGI